MFDHGRTIAAALNRVHAREPIDVLEMEESFGWAAQVANATDIPVVVKLHGPAFLHLMDEELATPFGLEKVASEGEALKQMPVITSPSRWTLSQTLARYELAPAIAEHVVNPLQPVSARYGISIDAIGTRWCSSVDSTRSREPMC